MQTRKFSNSNLANPEREKNMILESGNPGYPGKVAPLEMLIA